MTIIFLDFGTCIALRRAAWTYIAQTNGQTHRQWYAKARLKQLDATNTYFKTPQAIFQLAGFGYLCFYCVLQTRLPAAAKAQNLSACQAGVLQACEKALTHPPKVDVAQT